MHFISTRQTSLSQTPVISLLWEDVYLTFSTLYMFLPWSFANCVVWTAFHLLHVSAIDVRTEERVYGFRRWLL